MLKTSILIFTVSILSSICFPYPQSGNKQDGHKDHAADERNKPKPIDVVNLRMKAHNNHDLEKFLSTYSTEIQVYDYPNTPLGKSGREHLKLIFEPLFKEEAVSTVIHKQIEHGRYVINHETVTRRDKVSNYVSIYEVKDGHIRSVRLILE